MKVAGLFAGIGGFELGLGRAGHEAELFCDVLPASKAVLGHHFAGVDYREDITRLRSLPASIDLICAGFPCQDLSQAGLTAGLSGQRSGLISEVFRLLSRRRVSTVIVENVPFMLQLNQGRAIRAITNEFEQRGYRWAYRVVDTFGFGLPQRRERVFLVASRVLDPSSVLLSDDNPFARPKSDIGRLAHGFYWTEGKGGLGWAVDSVPTLKNGSTIGIPSPPAILLPNGQIIKPGLGDLERLQGFPMGWTLPAETVSKKSIRWSLTGSAVSVPVAEWLGQRLVRPGTYDVNRDRPVTSNCKAPRAARFDGQNQFAVEIGTDPVGQRPQHLVDFLRDHAGQTPLSLKATLGFLSRTRVAKLKFADGFIDTVERHARAMGATKDDLATKQMRLLAA